MQTIDTFEKNTLSIIITWVLADGTPKDLTGATVEAFAKGQGAAISLAAEVLDGPAGEVRVSAPADTLPSGFYAFQLRATKDAVTRTYERNIAVRLSLAA